MKQYEGRTLEEIKVGDQFKIIGYHGTNPGLWKMCVGETYSVTEVEDLDYEGDLPFMANFGNGEEWLDEEELTYEWVSGDVSSDDLRFSTLGNWRLRISGDSYELVRVVLEGLGYKSYHLLDEGEEEDRELFNRYWCVCVDGDNEDGVPTYQYGTSAFQADHTFENLNELVMAHTNTQEITRLEAQIEELQKQINKLKGN